MNIEVSKIEVSRRQLETAIKLFFYEGDAVSIHTLSAASFNVLNDLCRKVGESKKSARDEMLDCIIPDKRKWFLAELRKTENFLKHADRDSEETHCFDTRASRLTLFDAVRCYSNLTGEQTILTQAYFCWFLIEYPKIFLIPERFRNEISLHPNTLEGISKSEFLEILIPKLLKRGVV